MLSWYNSRESQLFVLCYPCSVSLHAAYIFWQTPTACFSSLSQISTWSSMSLWGGVRLDSEAERRLVIVWLNHSVRHAVSWGRSFISLICDAYIYIYIYAFSRRFYPKRLTVHSGYTFFVITCVPWESNPQLLRCYNALPLSHRNTAYLSPSASRSYTHTSLTSNNWMWVFKSQTFFMPHFVYTLLCLTVSPFHRVFSTLSCSVIHCRCEWST